MPIDASCVSDFTISGKASRFGRRIGRPIRKTSKSGTVDAVIRQQLLRQRLVARQQQPARVAAGVGQLQQLEMADDVLIEDRHVVEAFEQVEGDVRLPLFGRAADVAEVVVDAERAHLVAEAAQRRDDVELGAPRRARRGRCLRGACQAARGADGRARESRSLVAAHSATRCRPLCR